MTRGNKARRALIAFALAGAAAAALAGVFTLRSRAAAAAGLRGMSHHANLQFDAALSEYVRAGDLDPRDWRWPYYRALVHMERGEAAEAGAALRVVVAARPDLGIAWWRLGEAEFKQARFAEADAAYARAEGDPAVSTHARRGRARIAGASVPAARAYTPPRDPMVDALAGVSRSAVFLLRQAAAIDITRDPAHREKLVRRALEVAPDNPDVVYEVGSLLQQLRRPGDALPYFTRHLEMSADDQQTLVQIGKCYADLGRLEEAEQTLRRALAEGDDAVGFYNLGIVLEQRERLDEAEQSYRRAIALGPGLARARNNLGGLLARSGRLDEAARHLAEAIRLDPSAADAHTNLSAVLLQRGEVEEAARQARHAIDINPRHADAHANLGVALARLGDIQQAIRHFDEALRLDPRHASAQANRQAVTSAAGRPGSAQR